MSDQRQQLLIWLPEKAGLSTAMKIINAVSFDESLMIVLNGTVKGVVTNPETGDVNNEGDVDRFSMSYADLARQCYQLVPDIAVLRSIRGEHLAGADWVKLLIGATVTLERAFHTAGDVEGDYTFENTGYTTTIKSLKLSDATMARLDRALGF